MSSNLKRIPIDIRVQNIGIDHFTMPINELKADGFNVTVRDDLADTQGEQTPSKHLDWKEILKCIGNHDKETIVLDIPIGRGKTTCCYNLIEHYAKQDDTVIIVLSPFRKLVNKDYKEISTRGIDAFNYQSLTGVPGVIADEIIKEALQKKVQIMTINCLLQNPGEDACYQAFAKSKYLDKLRQYCTANIKKVMLFFDEIHESTHNFQSFFIPNLMKWMGLVNKCFVSSATFTVASYPVVKYIALLTDSNIEYLYNPRIKWADKERANIHLHILEEEYSKTNIFPLNYVKRLLEQNTNKQVNILCGTKSIVDAMTKKSINGKPNSYYEFTSQFNVTTGDNERDFDENGNNIGTTFKTGVNVTRKDNVFVIILPVIDTSKRSKSVFNDGLPSIVQAMARVRRGGDIHAFMYMPQYIIEPDPDAYHFAPNGDRIDGLWAFDSYQSFRFRLDKRITDDREEELYTGQFSALPLLRKVYNNMQANVQSELSMLIQAAQTHNLGFTFPSFEQFVMEKGYRNLTRNPIFGGDLSSIMLWCCMNGQFVNADLKTITLHARNIEELTLNQTTFRQQITQHIPAEVLDNIKTIGLKTAINVLSHSIETGQSANNFTPHHPTRKFIVDGKTYMFARLKSQPWFIKNIALLWTEANGLDITEETLKERYLLESMCQAMFNQTGPTSPLKEAYKKLYGVYNDFIIYCSGWLKQAKDGSTVIHHSNAMSNLPSPLVDKVKDIVAILKEHDYFIRTKGISFLQTLGKASTNDNDTIYKELRDLFTNISSDEKERKTIGKEINKYYPVGKTVAKVLPRSYSLHII